MIIKNEWFGATDHLLVGVSGGPDSMALLHALLRLRADFKWKLTVVHVNHQLREYESDEDATFVKEICRTWDVDCHVIYVNVKQELQEFGGNKQQTARNLRYDAFAQVGEQVGAHKMLLAHHADDQVETIMMRLLRGTGMQGLAGMKPQTRWKKLSLIRPFLFVSRAEIEEYCRHEHILFRTDSSNQTLTYTRNRLRLELIPQLETYNPHFKKALQHLSEVIHEEELIWDELTQEALTKVIQYKSERKYLVKVSSFLHLPIALQRRAVKLILKYLAPTGEQLDSFERIEEIRRLAMHTSPSVSIDLPHGLKISREYQLLCFSHGSEELTIPQPIEIPLEISLFASEMASLPGFMGKIEIMESHYPIHNVKPCHDWVVFDKNALSEPLMVRSRMAGEKMACYGMDGKKSVKSLFMEAKIPKHMRDTYPVISSGNQAVWIPGVRRSSIASIHSGTQHYLYLLWYKDS
nr:tRNA lysidine(34) synthetase TilS [Polycladospora coralii]